MTGCAEPLTLASVTRDSAQTAVYEFHADMPSYLHVGVAGSAKVLVLVLVLRGTGVWPVGSQVWDRQQ